MRFFSKVTEIIPVLPIDAGVVDPKSKGYAKHSSSLHLERKAGQRESVMQHFRNILGRTPLRFFGLPGETFGFEILCNSEWKEGMSFVGVEHSPSVLQNALIHAPGSRMKQFSESGLFGWRNSLGTVFCASLMEFFCRNCEHGRRPQRDRKLWAQRYKRNNAVWLDFTGNLSEQMANSLMRIGTICDFGTHSVPFCITFSCGRESSMIMELINHQTMPFVSPEMRRVCLIENWLSEGRFRTFRRTNVQIWPSSKSDNSSVILLSGILEFVGDRNA